MSPYLLPRLQYCFVANELMGLAWAASVQRARLYNPMVPRENRQIADFRISIFEHIRNLIPQYATGCDEKAHVENIESLVAHANKIGSVLLGQHGYKLGVAQKLLNLTLKYLWCLGLIQEPPHCPVDEIVVRKTGRKINWTMMRTVEQYLDAITAIRALADQDGTSLARWELKHYARRIQVDVGFNVLFDTAEGVKANSCETLVGDFR